MYESDRESISQTTNTATTADNSSVLYNDFLNVLKQYKAEHSAVNLTKLCNAFYDALRAIYASTRNDSERNIYFNMVSKISKIK